MHNTTAAKYLWNNKIDKIFYLSFLLSILLVWLPSKSFVYTLPLILILIYFHFFPAKSIIAIAKVASFYVLFFLLHFFLLDNRWILSGFIFHCISYGSFLYFFIIKGNSFSFSTNYSYTKYAGLLSKVMVAESVIGLLQLFISYFLNNKNFDLDAGDVVQGTILPWSFVPGTTMGIGNAFFVANICYYLFFLFTWIITKKKYAIVYLGLVIILLASVIHMLVFFLISILISLIFLRGIVNKWMKVIVPGIVIAFIGLYFIQPTNFTLISKYYQRFFPSTIADVDNPETDITKTFAAYLAISELPKEYPSVIFFGTGPGQFSSRSGLIATGKYFPQTENIKSSFFGISKFYKAYGYDLWIAMKDVYWGGSSTAPYFSLLSLYIEFGVILFGIFLFFFVRTVYRLKKLHAFFYRKKAFHPI